VRPAACNSFPRRRLRVLNPLFTTVAVKGPNMARGG
jgi:hypothetical protein